MEDYRKNIEILVRIFYYNKYLEKERSGAFNTLNKDKNSEPVYLIHNSWIGAYKSHFDFHIIEKLLIDNKEYFDCFFKDINYMSLSTIEIIIKNLPNDHIIKIINKDKFDKNKTFKYEYNQYKSGINYLCNNYIINSEIYKLLLELNYKLNDSIKKFDLYFIGNKKILLLSNKIGNNKDINEIGYINNKGLFIPEYIFNFYENNDISFDILNNFLKNDFINFHLNNNEDRFEIKNNDKKYGQCFKLDINQKNIFQDNIIINDKQESKSSNQSLVKIPPNKPPLVGLQNVGYPEINAILQCLFHIKPLIDYIKNNPHVNNTIIKYKNKNELCLTESVKILVDILWSEYDNNNHKKCEYSNNYCYAPFEFREKISKMCPPFKDDQYCELKEIIRFIIMQLHEELNIYKNINNNETINMNKLTDQNFMLNNFMNKFLKVNGSIIIENFYGIQHIMTTCLKCNTHRHNYYPYFFLEFPLEEVRKYKLQNITDVNKIINDKYYMNTNKNNNMMENMNNIELQKKINYNFNKIKLLNDGTVDIHDCFEYFSQIEIFTKENSIYCDICKRECDAVYQTKLYNSPEVLIIILNRGRGIQYHVNLNYDMQLSLINYLENPSSGYLYELIGIIYGLSSNKIHYVAICKNPINNLWYSYNDCIICPANIYEIKYLCPFILLYKKMKNNNQ